jgi:hypothetical protein
LDDALAPCVETHVPIGTAPVVGEDELVAPVRKTGRQKRVHFDPLPLAQVRDLLGHGSITTTERYDSQRMDSFQAAASSQQCQK